MKLLIISACISLFLSVSTSLSYEIRIDCGGDGSSFNSYSYLADEAYPGSQGAGFLSGEVTGSRIWLLVGDATAPALSAELFEKERSGEVSYRFDIPNGDYAVTLYSHEWEFHGPELREFDIVCEEAVCAEELDLFSLARMFQVVGLRFHVSVLDGQLDVFLGGDDQMGTLSAISVLGMEPDGAPPQAPGGLTAVGGYLRNILTWDPGDEEDLKGTRIWRSDLPEGPYDLLGEREDLCTFWFDDSAEVGMTYHYRISAFDLFDNESQRSDSVPASSVPLTASSLPMFIILMDPDDLQTLRSNPLSDEYMPAIFKHEGVLWGDTGTRYRGSWTRQYNKKNWKVRFDDELFEDRDRLNINSEYGDYSLIGADLAFRLFQSTHCMTPLARKVNLCVIDEYMGIFTEIEQIDEHFLWTRGITDIGNVYKCKGDLRLKTYYSCYEYSYEKETNEGNGHYDLIEFIELINETPELEFPEAIFQVLEVDAFLDYYAARILTGDRDFNSHNYYLYHDLFWNRWEVIPWDLDKAFQGWLLYTPINACTEEAENNEYYNRLIDRLMKVPKFRRRYCQRLDEYSVSIFGETRFDALVDSLSSLVVDDYAKDVWRAKWYRRYSVPDAWPAMKTFRDQRIEFLQNSIPSYLDSVAGLFINELVTSNVTLIQDEQGEFEPYLEVYNGSLDSILLSDYCITDSLTDPLENILPDSILPPGGFALLWADGEPEEGPGHLTFELSPGGGSIHLAATSTHDLPVESVSYPALLDDTAYGVCEEGWFPFVEMPATPGYPNIGNEAPAFSFIAADATSPSPTDTLWVRTKVTDAEGLFEVLLRWRELEADSFIAVPMLDDGFHHDASPDDSIFGALIPPQAEGTIIEYYASASDIYCLSNVHPPGAPEEAMVIIFSNFDSALTINEFLAKNDTTLTDPQGEYDDWLEIYNGTGEDVDLSGFHLSDDFSDPGKWAFPEDTEIAAGGFCLVWCDGDTEDPGLHANFKLDGDGEEIGLFGPEEEAPALIDTISFGSQARDVSMGRLPDGESDWSFFDSPTPGASNNASTCAGEAPLFLSLSPCYPNPFNPRTWIRCELPTVMRVRICVFDVKGRKITTLLDGFAGPGSRELEWTGSDDSGNAVASGIYFVRLDTGHKTLTRKVLLLK